MSCCTPVGLLLYHHNAGCSAQAYPPMPPHIVPGGTPFTVPDGSVGRTVYVDPAHGRDSRSGSSVASALRTLSAAWASVPNGQLPAGQGVRIVLLPGQMGEDAVSAAGAA